MSKTECGEIEDGLLGDTVAFLENNVIETGSGPEKGFPSSAFRTLDFTDSGPTKQGGRAYVMTTPNNAKLINGLLTVSYLPWGEDTGYYIILEPNGGPDIMMTATLSGCAVGYVRAGDGAVRVSHHNVQTNNMDFEQKRTLGFTNKVLHNSNYRYLKTLIRDGIAFDSEGLGFVFGVRRKGKWTMYAQTVDRTFKSYEKTGLNISTTLSITSARVF